MFDRRISQLPKTMARDLSSRTQAENFDPREQAERCRRLARTVTDQRTLNALNEMASEYEERALRESAH